MIKTNMLRAWKMEILMLCLFLATGVASLSGQTIIKGTGNYDVYTQVTKSVVGVNTTGASDIAVLYVGIQASGSDVYIGQIDIVLNGGDTLGTTNISSAKVYINDLTKYDPAVPTPTWTPIDASISATTATSVTITVNNDDALISPSDGNRTLWVAFDYDSNTRDNTPAKVSYYIDTIHYGDSDAGTAGIQYGLLYDPADGAQYGADPNKTENINDLYVSFDGAGAVANSTENQGENDVVVLSFTLSGTTDDESVIKEIASITVQSLGDDADVGSPGVRLHLDAAGNGTYESATDTQLTAALLSGGQAVLPVPVGVAQFDNTETHYLLVVNVDIDATIDNTIGLTINDPSTDIVFRDAIEDPGTYLSGQYSQLGYITTSSFSWTTNTFTITPAPDTTDPDIQTTNPNAGATNVDPETDIQIFFDQYMLADVADTTSVLYPGNVVVRDLVEKEDLPNITLDYSGQKLTITPESPIPPSAGDQLNWATTYSVWIAPGVQDVDGQVIGTLNPGGYEMTFTTRPEFPEVNAPTVLKNRIGTGANTEAVILIPTPSSGSFSGLSVKVFTTTGRLVKTFRGAEIETISNGRKIIWNGTNDRGADLGPGMYFVQVRVAGRKSVLKVMIVR